MTRAADTKGQRYVLVLRGPDRKGIVAAISGFLRDNDFTITESNQYQDTSTGTFLMRVEFAPDGPAALDLESLRARLAAIGAQFELTWEVHDTAVKPRVLIAVSRSGHCLYDLLHRWRAGILPIDVRAVFSNHDDLRSFVDWNGLPYHHWPVTNENRAEQERRIISLMDELQIDLLVLARYMQVLSPTLCERLAGRCINIHHSFLPGFMGARPYHQAHARGVKMIGATAHFVTPDLDDGPIIAQDTRSISHELSPEQMIALGQEVECTVLARAVAWWAEHRVLTQGRRTIVFA